MTAFHDIMGFIFEDKTHFLFAYHTAERSMPQCHPNPFNNDTAHKLIRGRLIWKDDKLCIHKALTSDYQVCCSRHAVNHCVHHAYIFPRMLQLNVTYHQVTCRHLMRRCTDLITFSEGLGLLKEQSSHPETISLARLFQRIDTGKTCSWTALAPENWALTFGNSQK